MHIHTDISYNVSMNKIFQQTKVAKTSRERQALSRLRQLLNEPGFLQASLFQRSRPCGKSYCRCATNEKYWHTSWYVGFSHKGRPQMKCIPEEWVEPVRLWIERYREAETLLRSISKLHWKRLKNAKR